MKYTPKELEGNVNVSPTPPVKEFFVLLGGILAIILVIYIVLGLAVDLIVPRLSFETEQSLGKLYAKFYDDREETASEEKLQQILDDLIAESQLTAGGYKVYVVPNNKVNALALPGGSILVFSALFEQAESENELAFVLAHELGHFANKDHLRGFGRGLVLLFISAALFGADSSATEVLMQSLVNVEMKFSQRQERLADSYALDLLNDVYGHVAGASDFMEKMAKRESKSRFLYYFATHPYPQDRIQALAEQVQQKGYVAGDKILLNLDH